MSYNNYGNRGRGFRGPTQAARAPRRFGRPRFPRPPFHHVAPPRPGPFVMPWQQNMFFQSHPLRGGPAFRGDSRRRRFCNYDIRFPAPNVWIAPMDYEEAMGGPQLEAKQNESAPQLPLLGSEEERQQKITETADRLKQKLSSFSSDEITDIWSEDVPSGPAEDSCTENKRIPVLGYKSSELNLTYNDLKDIGRINPDSTQNTADICNVTNNTDNSDVILDENDNGSQLVIPDQMTNLVNVMPDLPDDNDEYVATDSWQIHESLVDNSYNLEQLDVHGDNNTNENELLESDLQYNAPPVSTSQDQDYQQQSISQEIGMCPTDVMMEQDESEALNLQIASFPNDAVNQDILQQVAEEGFQNEFQNEVQNEFQSEVQNEFQSEVQNEFQSEVQNEFQSEVQNEFQSEVQNEFQSELQNEFQTEVQNEFQSEVQNEFQSELQNEFQTEVQNEFQTEVQNEFQSEVQNELQNEFQSEVQNEFQSEVQNELQSEVQNEMQIEVQNEELTNVEVQESVLNFHEHAENSNSNSNMLSQPVLTDVPVNNIALNNQLPRVKENAFHSGPPKLSPHTEQELPVDFDPTTPPPILLKQDQRVLPSYSISPDLPPLFNPTAPPPNMKCILGSTMPHEEANPPWNNAQNLMPAVYNNIEVHTGLNTHGGFILQPLPLEMTSQSNVFLPPHVDFSPIFPIPSSSHSGINVNVPSILPAMHVTSHNTYVSPISLPELSPSSDLSCSVNKDDCLDDMQEAMKFAKEMTNMSGKTDEESKSSSKSLSEGNLPVNPASEVEFIALPPGKPKIKTNKLKKVNDTSSKKKIVSEEQSAADRLSSEEIQEATMKSKEVSLIQEHDRPKVVFNLNNKTKVVNPKTWKENEKKNGMTQSVESEKTRAASSVTKKNFENTPRRIKEEKNLKRNENNSESTISSELVANQDATLLQKKLVKDNTEKSQCSTVSLYSKVNVQKSRSHVQKNENSNLSAEASWKNKIISRFLKMSKNDIYNMVNNTSLRKFDIIMKRLVKEKKPTLSLEMRRAQDEKMKSYDQQEFMKQLNAMLDTDAVVSITDLPTEFIHHLNEVLQLDVQPDSHAEPAAASNSQCGHSENTNDAFSSITHATECADKATSNNDVSQKCAKTKSHMTKTSHNEDAQEHNAESNYNYAKKDICNTIEANDSSITNLLSLQHDLDDIFSKITKKNKIPATEIESTRGNVEQPNAKRYVNVVKIRSAPEKEAPLEDAPRLLDCPRWNEKYEKWKRKEQEDPHAYRNLTKEEWEARYGTQANLTIPSVSVSTKRIAVNNKKLSSRGRGKKLYMRRRYSSESSKNTSHTRHRSLEKDKQKKSRRHSDDRGHSTGYHLEQNDNHDSNSSSSTSTSRSRSRSSSSSSNSSTNSPSNTTVTKLLRVIKEKEKVAKKMTLNEAIRDEVNAEIERERKSRKSRKTRSKSRKQKKGHNKKKKKKKQNKRTTSSSDSSSERDNNEEVTDRLLTEGEIKRESVENQITQEAIVKEELDIGHEENIESAEFANAPSLVMENKAAYLLPASQSSLESPSAQEIPLAAGNVAQPQPEDRQPTVSTPQPKTKAQLKQMPETSDMNDNKVPLNVFTCIPEDWRTFNPASLTGAPPKDSNKSCQTANTGCSQDKAVQSTDDSFTNQNSTADVACGEANESAVVQKLDACTSTESLTKIQDDNEIPADNNISTPVTSASSVSDVPAASAVTQRQAASKKIDIKTYYERNMRQRRINEKLESMNPENSKTENSTTTTRENALASKTAVPEIAVSKSTVVSTYSGSIQDPRLLSRSAVAPNNKTANNKDSIAETTAGKNIGQKEKRTNESTIAKPASKRSEEKNSNRIVNSDKIVRKINQDKVSLAANANSTNVSSSIVAMSKIAVPRPKKCSEIKETVTDEKSQGKTAAELKRFKNIRSEGGKELKLKKEIPKGQKPKKKSTVASKSISQVSTKACSSLEKTTTVEENQEKKIDNISNINKIEGERVQLTGSREDKVNNSNTKTEPSTTSSRSANNDNNKLLHNDVKTKERSSSCNNLKRKNVEKTIVNNIDDINAHEHAKTTRNKEIRHVKHAKNMASVEIADKKNQSAREICNVPELSVSTASKIAPEVPESKISSDIEKLSKKDFSTSDIRQSDAAKDTKLSLSSTDQDRIKKSNSRDASESTINRDVSSISESDATPRADSVDKRSKRDQLLINNNTKENNMELVEPDACKSASVNEDKSAVGKVAAPSSSSSNENSREQQGTPSDSIGSPFKGFLQETIMDFEPPNLFNLKLDEVDANKKNKIFLDDCNVDYAAGSCKDIEGQQDYETLKSSTDYTNHTNIDANENFNITFDNALLTSDKECATSGNDGKSDLTADESGEAHASKSSSEIVAATLRDGNNDVGGGESETARQLMSKEGYVIKESMFISEEETIPSEARSKDLASKLKTTTDPSLSDALEATASDDALRLPESQGAEHLDNHMYLETHISAEKTACDKLPSFDSDEPLDSDIFYMDDRLRGTATFDTKDDESVHFPVDEQRSPRYDIITSVASSPELIAPCANLLKPEERKLDLKHISSTDGDLLAEASIDTPRTLNIPTKAALKEPATSLFLKSPIDGNLPMASKEATLETLDKAQRSDAQLNYRTSAWLDEQNNRKTRVPATRGNTGAQDFINVNTISSTQNSTFDEPVCRSDGRKSVIASANIESRFQSSTQRNPVVELRKMKELDKLLEKRGQKSSEKMKERVYKGQKKHNGTIFQKLKDKRQMKYQAKTTNRISLVKRLKRMKRSGRLAGTTREAIVARMLEIDLEMHKLATEKLKLHELLQSNVPSTENSVASRGVMVRTREDDAGAGQSEVPSMLALMLAESSEPSHAKPALSSRSSIRKRVSRISEDDETTSYTPVHQKTKTPMIRWKKKPRLEQTVRREEDEDEQEDPDETAERQSSTSAKKKVNDSSIDASEDIGQKSESNTAGHAAQVDHETKRGEKITGKSDEEAACDIDSSRAICPDKSAADKSADDRSEWQDFAEGETERAKYFDIEKQNDVPPSSEATRPNSRPSSRQVRSTPEPSVHFDDSTWDSLVQNTAPEMHEHSKETGLALLDESFKKEQAKARKMKAIIRKKKKQQLDDFLRTVNNLTMEEEELPLSKLYIKKLRQKRDLLDSLSQRKEDMDLTIDPIILEKMDEVINAVAENRVENLYEPQSEARVSDDVPSTSSGSSILQCDKHQFYVDAEANANSDWPSREKENAEEVVAQQDSNDVPGADGSNHVFKAVSQDKALYDERNVEPDSSITPEETQIQSHSSDCEHDRSKDCNNGSRNYDIIVSVPKVLIKDDFSLEILQKFKDTKDGGLASTGLVDSTTNVFLANSERLEEKDKNSRDTAPAVNPIVEEKQENKKDENGETKDKDAVDANEREETVDSAASNTPSAPQSNPAKSGCSDETENEESGDSVSSNDKTAERDARRESSVSDSTVEKIDTSQKKSNTESEQLSNEAIALKQDCQNTENAAAKEEEKSNPENKSGTFERILDHDQSTGSSAPPDPTSEKSEDSNEASVEKSGLEHTLTSTFNKATAKGEEMSKKLRRRYSSAPVRRSTRNSNDNVKSNTVKEPDANSSSSERESSVLHQRNLTARSRSKSPSWAMPNEKVVNNGRKKRVAQKMQNSRRKVGTRAKNKNRAKHLDMIAESAASNNSAAAIAKKRKQQTEWQIKDCKVRLVDCKPVLLKYINPEVLDRFRIITVDPCAPSDSSCTQHTISNQNTVTPNTVSDKSFFSADKLCSTAKLNIEILIEKTNSDQPVKENSDKDFAQESVSQAAEIDEEDSTKMHYTIHKGPILDIKIFENSFLAASEDSKIYRYSQMSNGILNIYKGHKSAVTCLHICKSDVTGHTKNLMYSGSLDGSLRCYNITTGELVNNPVQVNSAIQCMDQAWGIIFLGTKSGHVSRFYTKTNDIKGNSIPFSDKSVLALKATNEGPRRILIVASRNQPIAIRDAHTGLFLRTISGQKNHTVYSLLRHDNLIYCGTSSTSINVFDFTTGEQAVQYDAGVGIVCMRLYKQLLFAGCYDGNIYVFDISNHKLVCSIHGPGNMLLSIEVVNNKIIAGSKDKRLHSWQMPTQVRALL